MVQSVRFKIDLRNRGIDKEEKLARTFRQHLEANGYTTDKADKKKEIGMISGNGGCKVDISYQNASELTLTFEF